jgi:hypothetical protein
MSIVVLKLLGNKESLILYLPFTLAFHSMYNYSDSSAFIFNFESPALTYGSLSTRSKHHIYSANKQQIKATKNNTPHRKNNALRERDHCYSRERSQKNSIMELP